MLTTFGQTMTHYASIIALAKTAASNTLEDSAKPASRGLDWLWGLGAPPALFAPHIAASAYAGRVAMPFEKATSGNPDPRAPLVSRYAAYYRNDNPDPANVKTTQALKRLALSRGIELVPNEHPLTYAYQPKMNHPSAREGKIHIGLNQSPPIIAHEIGHSLTPKKLLSNNNFVASQLLKSVGTIGGTYGALMSSNEDNSRNIGLLGSATHIPNLAAEVDASVRGGALLKRLGRSRWGAYIGLPTYGAIAATPLLAHYGKKLLGGFSKKVAPTGILPQLN
jgi:hypothetical protein